MYGAHCTALAFWLSASVQSPYTLPAAACSHSVRVPRLRRPFSRPWRRCATATGTQPAARRSSCTAAPGRWAGHTAVGGRAGRLSKRCLQTAAPMKHCWHPALGGIQLLACQTASSSVKHSDRPSHPFVQEWEPWEADMVVPLSPAELQQKVGRGGVQRR